MNIFLTQQTHPMKSPTIQEIEFTLFEVSIPNIAADPSGFLVWYEPGPGTPQKRFGVRIFTDEGVVGEYVPPRARSKVLMSAGVALAHALLKKPALERERHYQTMRRLTKHVGEAGIGALDIALWDLAGKYCGLSIAQMLGGHRWRLPAYASTIAGDEQRGGLNCPEAYADFAEICLKMSYPGFKMHGWKEGNPKRESMMIRAVAERVAGKMEVMYDAACHLKTLTDAIRVGRVCDEHSLLWYEDPYADGGLSFSGHKILKEKVWTPIMIGEHVRTVETHTDLMISGATDFGRVDPDYDGGITGCYKSAMAAEAMGIDVEVHSCGPAMRQLMAALSRSNYYEINLVHPAAPNPWQLPIYCDGYSDELDCINSDGMVEVSQSPGLGVQYDWNFIERTKLERIIVK
jgi:L-alanine-DL-glutamate epimerase-like enolase superfamily enzyme